ncbi:unnamed protein product [Rhizophagus irregularis]|nr:unnamed protein product [Rhizophagus irregularis]
MNHINNINVFCDSFQEGNMILYKHYDDDNSTVFRFRNRHTVGRGIGGFGTLGFLPKIDVSNIYAIVIKFQDRNVEEACKLLENCEIPAQQMIQDNKKSSPDDEPRHESLEILYHDKIKTELGLDNLGTSSATFARTYLIKVLSNYVVNM